MSKEIQKAPEGQQSKTAQRNAGNAKQSGTLRQYFEQENVKAALAKAMPEHMKPDRMMKVLLAAINRTPGLMKVSRTSLYDAAMTLSSLGLEPNSALGHAYLIPFGQEVQVIIGYKGYIELARRSGRIKSLRARVRRADEKFEVKYGLHEDLTHEYKGNSDAEVTHVYAVAEFTDGGYAFEVMTRSEVEAIRARSKSGKSGPWQSDWPEMAKKTVVRRLAKYLPLSAEMADAAQIDDDGDVVDSVAVPVPPAESPKFKVLSPDIEDAADEEPEESPSAENNTGEEAINPIERDFLEAQTVEELMALGVKYRHLEGPDKEAVSKWYSEAKERLEKSAPETKK